jgi:hypothetical protein
MEITGTNLRRAGSHYRSIYASMRGSSREAILYLLLMHAEGGTEKERLSRSGRAGLMRVKEGGRYGYGYLQ